MPRRPTATTVAKKRRFDSCPVDCKKLRVVPDSGNPISFLADYFSVISGIVSANDAFWFRGHAQPYWNLTPGALRYPTVDERRKALGLISDFKRIAEAKLSRLPDPDDGFKWAQIAQHYGLPTRLLDWTESATAALYFACLSPTTDGIVFVLNPIELNRMSKVGQARILDPQSDREFILRFLNRGPRERKRPSLPVAVNPTWSTERLIVQKGTFTLHGSLFSLNKANVPSLSRNSHPRGMEAPASN